MISKYLKPAWFVFLLCAGSASRSMVDPNLIRDKTREKLQIQTGIQNTEAFIKTIQEKPFDCILASFSDFFRDCCYTNMLDPLKSEEGVSSSYINVMRELISAGLKKVSSAEDLRKLYGNLAIHAKKQLSHNSWRDFMRSIGTAFASIALQKGWEDTEFDTRATLLQRFLGGEKQDNGTTTGTMPFHHFFIACTLKSKASDEPAFDWAGKTAKMFRTLFKDPVFSSQFTVYRGYPGEELLKSYLDAAYFMNRAFKGNEKRLECIRSRFLFITQLLKELDLSNIEKFPAQPIKTPGIFEEENAKAYTFDEYRQKLAALPDANSNYLGSDLIKVFENKKLLDMLAKKQLKAISKVMDKEACQSFADFFKTIDSLGATGGAWLAVYGKASTTIELFFPHLVALFGEGSSHIHDVKTIKSAFNNLIVLVNKYDPIQIKEAVIVITRAMLNADAGTPQRRKILAYVLQELLKLNSTLKASVIETIKTAQRDITNIDKSILASLENMVVTVTVPPPTTVTDPQSIKALATY